MYLDDSLTEAELTEAVTEQLALSWLERSAEQGREVLRHLGFYDVTHTAQASRKRPGFAYVTWANRDGVTFTECLYASHLRDFAADVHGIGGTLHRITYTGASGHLADPIPELHAIAVAHAVARSTQ